MEEYTLNPTNAEILQWFKSLNLQSDVDDMGEHTLLFQKDIPRILETYHQYRLDTDIIIKNCPCCNAKAELHYIKHEGSEYVQCTECLLQTETVYNGIDLDTSELTAIQIWNKRCYNSTD